MPTLSETMGLPGVSRSNLSKWFTEEVKPHEPALRGWLRARFPSLVDRDDLVQESFLRLLRARAGGSIASAKAFLFATARNLAYNRVRDRRQEQPDRFVEIDASRVLDEGAAVSEQIARAEEMELLTQAIRSLPSRCREVFTLRKIYGLPQKDVAAQLGIAERTVETQTAIALDKCMRFFERHGDREDLRR